MEFPPLAKIVADDSKTTGSLIEFVDTKIFYSNIFGSVGIEGKDVIQAEAVVNDATVLETSESEGDGSNSEIDKVVVGAIETPGIGNLKEGSIEIEVVVGVEPMMKKYIEVQDVSDDTTVKELVPTVRDTANLLQKSEIKFLNQVQGHESIAFDPLGRGPYIGVADGCIVFWDGQKWNDFAYTSSNRSELCSTKPSSLSYLPNEHICGRPLGLRFDNKTGDMCIADAYLGLLKVGPEGGLATSLVTEADGGDMTLTLMMNATY